MRTIERFGGHQEFVHQGNPSPRAPGSPTLDAIERANPVASNTQPRGTTHSDYIPGLPTAEDIEKFSARARSNSPKCADATKYRK
jgi:hypothetical protein